MYSSITEISGDQKFPNFIVSVAKPPAKSHDLKSCDLARDALAKRAGDIFYRWQNPGECNPISNHEPAPDCSTEAIRSATCGWKWTHSYIQVWYLQICPRYAKVNNMIRTYSKFEARGKRILGRVMPSKSHCSFFKTFYHA